ncbi:hypothetical protein [Acinetobacter lanii]|uniref:hypothetical protein n=1 Tax=Acinetobacter lanii TaxID=2715163 RepID=UPI0029FEE122|nr:hypothetical protein [Acinetobacter lanii]
MKKIVMASLGLFLTINAQAFEKSQVNLDKDFWGKWSVFNAKSQCTENYEFKQPGQVTYSSKQKKMSGEFAVLRSKEPQLLDVLAMKIKTDNQQAGCGNEKVNYTDADIRLGLKWVSKKSAELCTDAEAKQCTGLYLIKQ